MVMVMTLLLFLFPLIDRSNIATLESSQQLVALFKQAIFWAPWDQKYAPWAFFQPNNDEHVSLETEQVICYILCHLVPLDPHVLGQKLEVRKE
jgi:hypothetical protein